ncbi:MAG TPA: NAD(P)H-hydrate epimerase, partial [Oligoflexia bacterium]|nr:NAD(P)H-hydrate epimerase [Oligoflexia bacterium]
MEIKILLAEEMRTADSALFSRIGVPSRAVMESAGREVAGFLLEQMPDLLGQGVLVLAGSGNNGGDGFVVAR